MEAQTTSHTENKHDRYAEACRAVVSDYEACVADIKALIAKDPSYTHRAHRVVQLALPTYHASKN